MWSAEIGQVKDFPNPETLDITGQLFYQLATIPRLEQRLKTNEIAFK
jgi:hypothetical protein